MTLDDQSQNAEQYNKEALVKKTFAFDFAGVISTYKGSFVSEETCAEDEPNQEVVRLLHKKGHKIIVHSTLQSSIIAEFCKKHDIPITYINENPEFSQGNPGKPVATVYIDDRAFNYSGQTTEELVEALEKFKPYYK